MSERKPTAPQQDAIDARGNIIVSAAAGSGKTFVLTERVIARITGENAVDINTLLIVTFTNAAAAEMKNRISRRLEAEIQARPQDANLMRQQLLLGQTDICTVDSFCVRLLHEYFQSADVPPDLRPADEASVEKMKAAAAERTCEYYCSTEDKKYFEVNDSVSEGRGDAAFIEIIGKVNGFLQSIPYPEEWLNDVLKAYSETSFEKTRFYGYIRDYAIALCDYSERLLQKAQRICAESALEKLNAKTPGEIADDIIRVRLLREKTRKGSGEALNALMGCDKIIASRHQNKKLEDNDDFRIMNSCIKAAEDSMKRFSALIKTASRPKSMKAGGAAAEKLVEILRMYRENLRDESAASGSYSFADIEAAALRLLCVRKNGVTEPTAVGRSIAARYSEVMVDEFQDINDLQYELFRVLSDGEKNLFTVGDIKQSIYGFRQANPDIFLKRYNSMPRYEREGSFPGGRLALMGNFRSRGAICEFVNMLFSRIYNRATADMDYDEEQKLVAANPALAFTDAPGGVKIDLIGTGSGSKAEAEGKHIAARIMELRQTECVTSPDGGGTAKPEWRDFAVLLQSRTNASEIIGCLESAGIPCVSDVNESICTLPAVKAILAVLRIIDNPADSISFFAAMISPLFGFSPDEAAQLRLNGGKRPLFESVRLSALDGDKKSLRMDGMISEFRRDASRLPVNMLLRRIYDSTFALVRPCASMDDRTSKPALECLLTRAEQYETQNRYGSLGDFVRYIEASKIAPISGKDAENAVRVMTIHSSKGLEFPICFVSQLSSPFNLDDEKKNLLTDSRLGIGFREYDPQNRAKLNTPMREAIRLETHRRTIAEKMRLLYVALTRARDCLILTMCAEDSCKVLENACIEAQSSMTDPATGVCAGIWSYGAASYRKLLLPVIAEICAGQTGEPDYRDFLKRCTGMLNPDGSSGSGNLRGSVKLSAKGLPVEFNLYQTGLEADYTSDSPEITAAGEAVDETTADDIEKALRWEYPYSALNGICAKMAVTELNEKRAGLERECASRPAFMSESGLTPAQRGTAMHYFLESADYSAAAQDVRAEAARLAAGDFITKKQADCLDFAKLGRFFASPVYRRIAAAQKVYREMRFMTELPARTVDPLLPDEYAAERIVVQGIADCVFIENGEAIVLDYKTDRVEDMAELARRYSGQLAVYADAIEDNLGIPVRQRILYSLYLGEELEV